MLHAIKSGCLRAAVLAVGVASAGCLGQTHTVTVDAETARLEFGVVAVSLETGSAEVVDFCVVLNDSICGFPGGEALACGLDVPLGTVNVFCADPILAQWPDTWTLLSATWNAPSVAASGNVLVEPAFNFALQPGASITTDPGYSAYVLRLDLSSDFGPADVDFTLEFDHGNDLDVQLKAVEVMTSELQSPSTGKILVPLGDLVIDFPNMPMDNVLDIRAALAVEHTLWSRVKQLFKE